MGYSGGGGGGGGGIGSGGNANKNFTNSTNLLCALAFRPLVSSVLSSNIVLLEMSVKYAKRFEAVFLCYHPKGHPKMTVRTAAKYLRKSRQFVDKCNGYNVTKKQNVRMTFLIEVRSELRRKVKNMSDYAALFKKSKPLLA
ncbi:hypothetical protein K0M31_003663 [Melipona bicolor]|uniref:Uncharacterized protein n=1 Tax=Melipona bicolor TaxID=60889 RepID=A0AA40FY15_9HYME|nr:hypothetical protein K0M31_003663 [Melipona bicolor]